MIAPDKRDAGQLLPASHFGDGILTWHLPILFRTPPGYNLLVRGPANYPKDAVSPLEGIVETDWARRRGRGSRSPDAPSSPFVSAKIRIGPPGAHCGRRIVVGMPLSGEYAPSTSDWAREQADKYMESDGTDGTELNGRPVILLTTVGAKTGKLRKTPLMRVEHNGEYAIVASLGGAPKNPVWYYNVAKNPRVELQDGTVTRDYDAREVSGDEKAAWWERAVAAFPPYADYQKKTDRQIPLFVLTPVS